MDTFYSVVSSVLATSVLLVAVRQAVGRWSARKGGRLARLLRDVEEDGGPITEAEKRAARRKWER
ncbi:hypothetical protein ACFRFJ_19455 [Streptomyces hydrogenans]|uniref:hypothetical protein n=1 Tax=Streptomyces hydrogenans TaxID=1873719 RepID=UPI003642EBD1